MAKYLNEYSRTSKIRSIALKMYYLVTLFAPLINLFRGPYPNTY